MIASTYWSFSTMCSFLNWLNPIYKKKLFWYHLMAVCMLFISNLLVLSNTSSSLTHYPARKYGMNRNGDKQFIHIIHLKRGLEECNKLLSNTIHLKKKNLKNMTWSWFLLVTFLTRTWYNSSHSTFFIGFSIFKVFFITLLIPSFLRDIDMTCLSSTLYPINLLCIMV